MASELSLRFPDPGHVEVTHEGVPSGLAPFTPPLSDEDRRALQWYLEVYGAHSLGEPDDEHAKAVERRLPEWGKALFEAVFAQAEPRRLFNRFQEDTSGTRLLTIGAEHPAVLALPWELLYDSSRGGGYLFQETPRISIRRRLPGATGGRSPYRVKAKKRVHLLFVVCRPEGAGFVDPRADGEAVLDALGEHGKGRVTSEFLRPPTLDALLERLEDRSKPLVDIVHFDAHGVFDRDGGLPKRVEEGLRRRFGPAQEVVRASGSPGGANTGYLLFEDAGGGLDLVSAEKLGSNLARKSVALVVLSACQSAAVGEEDPSERPLGTMAARLLGTGIPSVLAMTHSVLVATTRALFGELYGDLARGRGLGESLDNARRHLANHPEKYEVRRGEKREWLRLQDWFLPALYQSGEDEPLLDGKALAAKKAAAPRAAPRHNLRREPEAGFHGRRRELWEIERWLAGKALRVTVSGFGGQGKTALAEEAARWMLRTGLFEAAVFVDYARIQTRDALAVAVSNVGTVLGESLPDADAASEALRETRTLVILDNLEALAAEPLQELLGAAAKWSESEVTRVLCTTRRPDLGHPEYRVEGTHRHRRLKLEGLGSRQSPGDALEWFGELWKLPPDPKVPRPAREEVVDLFDRVRFHPLSLRVLAQQLKTRPAREIGMRLEEELAKAQRDATAAALGEDTAEGLVASLRLSLDRLDAQAREVLPRLGVFQGGAMEDDLLAITGLEEGRWGPLGRQLEAAALLEAEEIPGVTPPYLRFHPTLAPMLWSRLGEDERARLAAAHRKRYYALAAYLCNEDSKAPLEARAIARLELPNLLHAAKAAFETGDENAVDFAARVNRFLTAFGLTREADALARRAASVARKVGSEGWYLAQLNRGKLVYNEGKVGEAVQVFTGILEGLGPTPSYRRAVTISWLGRSLQAGGRPDLGAEHQRAALAILEGLPPSDHVKQQRGFCHTEFGDALRDQGRFPEAREEYGKGLSVYEQVGDLRSQGVISCQLGTLAMLEGKPEEAMARYRAALALFQQLREPGVEAAVWHQLGRVFHEANQWDEAERHYRESARINQELGNVTGAATTWGQLAICNAEGGRPDAAEAWFRKAIEESRGVADVVHLSRNLSNLAELLRSRPGGLAEARRLAEEALAAKRTIDPAASEIWTTHYTLARIDEAEAGEAMDPSRREALRAEARAHSRAALDAKRRFAGTGEELKRHRPLILGTVRAVSEPAERAQLEGLLAKYAAPSWKEMVSAIRRILAGERNEEALQEGQYGDGPVIIDTIIRALSDPSVLANLLSEAGSRRKTAP